MNYLLIRETVLLKTNTSIVQSNLLSLEELLIGQIIEQISISKTSDKINQVGVFVGKESLMINLLNSYFYHITKLKEKVFKEQTDIKNRIKVYTLIFGILNCFFFLLFLIAFIRLFYQSSKHNSYLLQCFLKLPENYFQERIYSCQIYLNDNN